MLLKKYFRIHDHIVALCVAIVCKKHITIIQVWIVFFRIEKLLQRHFFKKNMVRHEVIIFNVFGKRKEE